MVIAQSTTGFPLAAFEVLVAISNVVRANGFEVAVVVHVERQPLTLNPAGGYDQHRQKRLFLKFQLLHYHYTRIECFRDEKCQSVERRPP